MAIHKKSNPLPGLGQLLLQAVLSVIALFFTGFGIEVLILSFAQKDPFSFIMTFFSSNLIILISLALLAGFVYKIFLLFKTCRKEND